MVTDSLTSFLFSHELKYVKFYQQISICDRVLHTIQLYKNAIKTIFHTNRSYEVSCAKLRLLRRRLRSITVAATQNRSTYVATFQNIGPDPFKLLYQ